MSLGRLFDISSRTLSTYQRAIEVTSNNISNAGNAEYSRQKVNIGSDISLNGIGIGVKISDIQRVRDDMVDAQIRKYQSALSSSEKKSEMLGRIETILSEPSEMGLSNYLAQFFNSWQELTVNPTSIQMRSNVLQKAKRLAERYNDIKSGIEDVQSQIINDARIKVSQLNTHVVELRSLNQKIFDTESRGVNAGELKDQRDAIIQKVAKLANVTVSPTEQGAVTVNVGGLLAADQVYNNQFVLEVTEGELKISIENDRGSKAVVNSGEIGALLELHSKNIGEYKNKFNTLITTLTERVNHYHEQGFALDGSLGTKFFEMSSDGKLMLNVTDPVKLAAADVTGNTGNAKIANQIYRIAEDESVFNGSLIIDEYTNILNSLGTERISNDDRVDSNELILQQLQNQRASVSGVSLDEEMTNVLKYQRSYDAAARLVKVADDMLQTILNMV
ncbi:MAG: flagellar hook-associated protein FlgK [Melioribacteraceae bacterium]|nr:flagellar hook-associated protein FlgK [Melioribacteraceae bacterium]